MILHIVKFQTIKKNSILNLSITKTIEQKKKKFKINLMTLFQNTFCTKTSKEKKLKKNFEKKALKKQLCKRCLNQSGAAASVARPA